MAEYRLFLFNISEIMDMLADGCVCAHIHTAGDGCASRSGNKAVVAVLFSK